LAIGLLGALGSGCLLDRSGVDVGGPGTPDANVDDPDANGLLPDADVFAPDASATPVSHVTTQTNSAAASDGVAGVSVGIDLVPGDLYIAAIASSPGSATPNVRTVIGPNGLPWNRARGQCASAGGASLAVYTYVASQTLSGDVQVSFENGIKAAAVTVSQYTDVSGAPGAIAASNADPPLCGSGSPSGAFDISLTPQTADGAIFLAVSTDARSLTADPSFASRGGEEQSEDEDRAGLVVLDRQTDGDSPVQVAGGFDASADWAVIAIELKRR
jgi:hypothetical protein